MGPWRIRQFGAVALEGAGFEDGNSFKTQRAAKILTLLALVRNGKMRREDLADALWPDDFYDATRLRLRQELSRLRQALGPAADVLVSDGEFIGLDRTAFETDVEILRRCVKLADDDPRREAKLREAVQASAGPFLPGWNDPWVVAERNAAESLKCRVIVGLGEILLAQGDAEAALATVREAIEHDPCHEAARMVAIRAHAALGSLAAAVGEFQQMKRLMRERNDQAPSIDAEALLMRVQEGEVAPAVTARLPALSASLDRFFGRREEMAALMEALSLEGHTRLVSLVGTGGIGKSRLANEAALALREAYSGNVAFVSMAESPSFEAAAATLLAHLGWQGTATADPAAVVASSLPNGPCLFVLDNLEHLMPEASGLVKRLLEACPSLRVLATSRQSLRLAGERIVTVGPLGEAAEMLTDLVRSVRPELADDPDLGELALRLDGIPLALRLAASRLRVLGPKALLQRLGDRFRVLQGDAPDLPARHRSLRAALDGSFEALGDRERRALVMMSPFRGGWTLAHVKGILPHDALEAMEALVDASLVAVDDRGSSVRFSMLETVREYAMSQDGGDEASKRFVRAMASELYGLLPDTLTPRSFELLDTLDAEADNLHLAVEAAIVHDPGAARTILSRLWIYDTIRGRHADLERLYRDYDQAHSNGPFDAAAEFGRGMALAGLNKMPEATAVFREVERVCRRGGDHTDAALVEAMRLVTERRLVRTPFAEVYARLQAISERVGDSPAAVGRLAMLEGDLLYFGGRLEKAASRTDQAIALAKAVGDDVGVIIAVHYRGFVSLDLGEYERVRETLAEIAPSVERLGDPRRRGAQHELLGKAATGLGALSEALEHLQIARGEWSRLGNAYQLADQDNSIARALLELDRLDEARLAALAAFRGWCSYDDHRGAALALHSMTAIRLAMGEPGHASAALAMARRLAATHELEFVPQETEFLEGLAARIPPGHSPPGDPEALFD